MLASSEASTDEPLVSDPSVTDARPSAPPILKLG
jgi:hypothetical protein